MDVSRYKPSAIALSKYFGTIIQQSVFILASLLCKLDYKENATTSDTE